MKTIALASVVILAAGCGGSWSNKDLEFLNALPTREQLESKIPVAAAGGLSGVGTRRDGLGEKPMLGMPNQSYKDTHGASIQFNQLLSHIIDVIELVRSVPPTSRTIDSRTWGPWADTPNPGFEVEVVIKQIDPATFAYAFRQRAKGGEFFDSVTGGFKATVNLHKGSGGLKIDVKGAAAAKVPVGKDFVGLDEIQIQYQTETLPTTVAMLFNATPGGQSMVSSVGYLYQETMARSGQMYFAVNTTNPDITQYVTLSRWLLAGAGGSTTSITEGNFKGATQTDCWDAAFNTTYAKQGWPGGIEIGDVKSCVTVEGFSP